MNFRKLSILFVAIGFVTLASCSASKKGGCPANGKAVGAERILAGEKVPKAKKFKA
ncbi:hypothetical protein KJS94_10210 [Flavihumibacter rivuli]|uniref:hypothetical protein n=1 Tax=Flavihumibacter rivuli TaxID=2838156 RepID=UPI001BDDEDDF|nr:hypothetical protein [Flavihumibacter rivuli]ULQ55011.1 hypothetical protein KJS94_10210 [Flavihumibacter rivuli]